MQLNEVLDENLIFLDLNLSSREEVLEFLATKLKESGRIDDVKSYLDCVYEREKEYSTAIGGSVAIPHGKSSNVLKTSVAFARLSQGVDWNSFDGKPVELVFLLAIADGDQSKTHMKLLSTIATNLMEEEFVAELYEAKSPKDIMHLTQYFRGGKK